LGLGALVGSIPLQAAEDPGIELPPVPRAVLLAANDPPATIRHVSAEAPVEDAPEVGEAPAATLALGSKTVLVSPGTTAIVEVAIDHLNRIVTPFTSPQVRTVSRATTQVDGNAIYVATASEEPVSLFITEAGDTAMAISLTLAPRHIPPREVRLVLTGGVVPVRTTAPTVKPPGPWCATISPMWSTSPPSSGRWRRTGCPPATSCARPIAASALTAASSDFR
jgi:hypothetical protein